MSDPRYDPDEKFSLYPLDPEEGLKRLLRGPEEPNEEPAEEDETDSEE